MPGEVVPEAEREKWPQASALFVFSVAWLLGLLVGQQNAIFAITFVSFLLLLLLISVQTPFRLASVGFFLGLFQILYLNPLPTVSDPLECIWQLRLASVARFEDDHVIVPAAKIVGGWSDLEKACGGKYVGSHIRLQLSGVAREWVSAFELVPGRDVRLRGRLSPPRGFRNPGVNDPSVTFKRMGLIGKINATKTAVYFIPSWKDVYLVPIGRILKFRQSLHAAIGEVLDAKQTGLVAALLLGEQRWLEDDSQKIFSITGCSHLFAASGFNVALVLLFSEAIFYGVARRLRWLNTRVPPRLVSALLALPFLIAYIFLTGCADASVRAGMMASCFLLARINERRMEGLGILGLCLLFELLVRPEKIWSISWQLSFASTFAIIVGLGHFSHQRKQQLPDSKIVQYFFSTLEMTFWAVLATAPLILAHFQTLSFWGLLTNIPLIPLISFFVLPASFISVFFFGWAHGVFVIGIKICGWVLQQSEDFLVWFTTLPGPYWENWLVPWQFYFVFILAAVLFFGRVRREIMLAVLGCMTVLTFDGFTTRLEAKQRTFDYRAIFLDVGHGDAAIVQTPDNKTLLIDAGGWPFRSQDQGIILKVLRHLRIDSIDSVFLSHPHPDHLGGLKALFENIAVGQWIHNGQSEDHLETLTTLARKKGITVVVKPQAFEELQLGKTVVRLLNPHAFSLNKKDFANLNNRSLVVAIQVNQRWLLFTGDMEKPAEAAFLKEWQKTTRLPVDILKVPHHGSNTSSHLAFLQSLLPRLAIASCGLGMRAQLPHPQVILRYQKLNIPLLTTKACGAVTLTYVAGFEPMIHTQKPCQ